MRVKAPDRERPDARGRRRRARHGVRDPSPLRAHGRGCAHDHHRRRRGRDGRPHDARGRRRGGSGTIYLETSLAFADAISADRVRAVAGAAGCRRRCPAPGSSSTASSPTRSGTTWTPRWRPRRGCTSSSTARSGRSSGWRRSSTRCAGVTPARPSRGAPASVGSSKRCRRTRPRTCARRPPSCSSCGGARSPQSPRAAGRAVRRPARPVLPTAVGQPVVAVSVVRYRNGANMVRISSEKICGSSQAAKWPPRAALLK